MKDALALLVAIAAHVEGKHYRLALEDDRLVVEFVHGTRVARLILDASDLSRSTADLLRELVELHAVHKNDPVPPPRPAACGEDPRPAWYSILDAAVLHRLNAIEPITIGNLWQLLTVAFGFAMTHDAIVASLDRVAALEHPSGWTKPQSDSEARS